jgi:HK97 family phage major capsid protein
LGQNEQVPADGGFLVGTEQETMLEKKIHDSSVFINRAQNRTIGAGANSVDFYGVDEDSRATGSRFGGIRGYRVAEGATITASQMKFYKYTLKPEKYAALAYATNEVARNASLLGQEIASAAPLELAFMIDDDMLNGVAAGYPRGVLAGAPLVTVAKEAGQAADTVNAQNVIKMWARLWTRSRANAVWFINQDVEPQLTQLSIAIGTAGQLLYMPPTGLSGQPYGTLYGRPVIPTEFNATLGDLGDIVLADFSQYKLANMGGVQAASSMHVQFLTDQMAWRFTVEYDGQPTWKAALTPYKGSNTISPFVTLAERA